MKNNSFQKGKEIIELFHSHGYEAFFVGGSVRDLLLGYSIGDIDIATSATPERMKEIFDRTVPVGIEHGTIIIIWKGESFEVTTFRTEDVYTDQRHPDSVQFVTSIEKDLSRRDFTMNALAMDKEGEIIDLFHARDDIAKNEIRCVGYAFDRFKEDPLRILRALRFSSQLGFDIEQETYMAAVSVQPEIETLASERITAEMTKLFAGDYIRKALSYMRELKTYHYMPIFNNHPGLFERMPRLMQPLYSFGEVIALFRTLETGITSNEWVKAWKCSRHTKQEAEAISEAWQYFTVHHLDAYLVYFLPEDFHAGFLRVLHILEPDESPDRKQWQDIVRRLPIRSRKDLVFSGNDLIALFPDRAKGPWIQQTLDELERAVVCGKIKNKKTELEEWASWYLQRNP